MVVSQNSVHEKSLEIHLSSVAAYREGQFYLSTSHILYSITDTIDLLRSNKTTSSDKHTQLIHCWLSQSKFDNKTKNKTYRCHNESIKNLHHIRKKL